MTGDGRLCQEAFLWNQRGRCHLIAKYLNPLIFGRSSYIRFKFGNATHADHQMCELVQKAKGAARQRVLAIYRNDWEFICCNCEPGGFLGGECSCLKDEDADPFNAVAPRVERSATIGILPLVLQVVGYA